MSWNIKTPGDYINGPLTVVGDVTVGSNAFRVDTVNKRIGVNIANPAAPAHIYASGSDTASVRMQAAGGRTFDIGSTASGYGAANNFIIYDVTAGAERLRCNSAGDFGFGTTNYIAKIQAAGLIAAADATFGTSGTFIGAILNNDNAAPGLDLRRWTGGAAIHGTTYICTDYTGNTYFYNGQQSSNTKATALKMLLNTTGALVFNGGNAAANGTGIAFPAAQSASTDANTLDDYEEGTFTPVLVGATTAGVGTYTTQVGRYTKIGNIVTVQIYFYWTGHTGTGGMQIAGLPFNLANVSGLYGSPSFGLNENISLTAGYYLGGYANINSDRIILLQYPVGGGSVLGVPVDATGELSVSLTYRVS